MLKHFKFIAVATIIALGVYGCSMSDGPTAPASAPNNSLLGSLTGTLTGTISGLTSSLLLRCEALPPATATQTIGRNGGTINIGPHKLVIPAGALSRDTRITAELPGDNVTSVRFSPEGLKFSKSASLTMSYAHCTQLLPLPIRIVYTTESLDILELLTSNDDRAQKKVSAPLKHFSRYALAWRNTNDEDGENAEEGVSREDVR